VKSAMQRWQLTHEKISVVNELKEIGQTEGG
jgi:hypothetical protein